MPRKATRFKKPVLFSLSEDTIKKLDEAATKLDLSKSRIITLLVNKFLQNLIEIFEEAEATVRGEKEEGE